MGIVALPANIFFTVGFHINRWQVLGLAGFLVMTFTAEFPFIRFGRYAGSRRNFMLFRHRMAFLASNQRMIGNDLGPFDLSMASGARIGDCGWCRIMRIVAGDARFQRIMRIRVYLGKSRGP